VAVLFCPHAVLADAFDDAIAAYHRRDYETALRAFKESAEQRNAKAQFYLRMMYDVGEGVPPDSKESAKWYRMAADQGNAKAQVALGSMYFMGLGVPQHFKEGLNWYRKAADQGNAKALIMLAEHHYYGYYNEPQHYKKALKWYRKAANQGVTLGQARLGIMYYKGQGVPQDHVTAYMWLILASVGGSEHAVKNRDLLARSMTPSQIAEAQKMAREWKPTPSR